MTHQTFHALVFVLAAHKAAKRVHEGGTACALLQVPCRPQCTKRHGMQWLPWEPRAASGMRPSAGHDAAVLVSHPRRPGSGAAQGRLPRQGQAKAASTFFSTSSSLSALASASAIAPFIALELYSSICNYAASPPAPAAAATGAYCCSKDGARRIYFSRMLIECLTEGLK